MAHLKGQDHDQLLRRPAYSDPDDWRDNEEERARMERERAEGAWECTQCGEINLDPDSDCAVCGPLP